MFKKIIGVVLTVALVLVTTTPALAQSNSIEASKYYLSDVALSDADQQFLKKVVSVGAFFEINSATNNLSITLTENELINEYGFTQDEYDRLMTDVVGTKFSSGSNLIPPKGSNLIQPNISVSNGTLYISYYDLVDGIAAALLSAAYVGPTALGAALTALSSMLGGPVGTIIGTIAAFAALPSLRQLCGMIIYAVATGQGIYIKPVPSYPPLVIGYWPN